MGTMPVGLPTKADFDGNLLQVTSIDWHITREADSGGANMSDELPKVPGDRVIVEFDARETSCIRCHGTDRDVRVVSEPRGILSVPVRVHVGVRFDAGGPLGAQGASYSGTITMVTVPFAAWKAKAIELIG